MNISIITNFGCNSNCWYCIWKNHKLKNEKRLDYRKLEEFLSKYKHKGKVSISGGGDPLYNFYNNSYFWSWIIDYGHNNNILIDIHSRVKLKDIKFWSNINLLAFSSDKLEDDIEYLQFISKIVKTRIVHVITGFDTKESINKYIEFSKNNNAQLTFKQLYGFKDNGMYDFIKNNFKDVYTLDTDDYNIYFMPDNKEYNKFKGGN